MFILRNYSILTGGTANVTSKNSLGREHQTDIR